MVYLNAVVEKYGTLLNSPFFSSHIVWIKSIYAPLFQFVELRPLYAESTSSAVFIWQSRTGKNAQKFSHLHMQMQIYKWKSFRLLRGSPLRTNKKLCVAPAASAHRVYIFIGDVPPAVANSWNVHVVYIIRESERAARLHALDLCLMRTGLFQFARERRRERERWPAVWLAEWRQSIFIDSEKSHLLFMGPRTHTRALSLSLARSDKMLPFFCSWCAITTN